MSKSKVNFQLDFQAGVFYSAAVAVTAFRALGFYPKTNRYAWGLNPGQWFSWLVCWAL